MKLSELLAHCEEAKKGMAEDYEGDPEIVLLVHTETAHFEMAVAVAEVTWLVGPPHGGEILIVADYQPQVRNDIRDVIAEMIETKGETQ